MAISKNRFSDPNIARDVEMPEPFNCIFSLKPIKTSLHAEWQDRAGQTMRGIRRGKNGEDEFEIKLDPHKAVTANIWLAKKIIVGWQGLDVLNEDTGEVEPMLFSDSARDQLAAESDLFNVIVREATRLAGRLSEEEEKN